MLRTGPNYNYDTFKEEAHKKEYEIAPDDELSLMVYTNEGQKIIDPLEHSGMNRQNRNNISFIVENNGMVKLPQLGRIEITGYTEKEAEELLENKYANFYNEPFVELRVTNKRVIVFPGGEGGTSKVIYLENQNTTLFEALAEAGGINDGKAHRVKLIRGDLKDPKVYLIDLSTIEGVKEADLVLQANDIIYVQPRNKIPEKIIREISPYLTLITTILLINNIFNNN